MAARARDDNDEITLTEVEQIAKNLAPMVELLIRNKIHERLQPVNVTLLAVQERVAKVENTSNKVLAIWGVAGTVVMFLWGVLGSAIKHKFGFAVFITFLLLVVSGCNDVNTAMGISARPDVHCNPTVFDVTPTYDPPKSEPLVLTVEEIKQSRRADEVTPDEPFAGFKAWKADTDPREPFAGFRKWLRDQD